MDFSFFSSSGIYSKVALSCELNKLILDADFEIKEMKTWTYLRDAILPASPWSLQST